MLITFKISFVKCNETKKKHLTLLTIIIKQTAKLVKQDNYVLEIKFHELSKEINILTSSTSANTKAIAVDGLIEFLILRC